MKTISTIQFLWKPLCLMFLFISWLVYIYQFCDFYRNSLIAGILDVRRMLDFAITVDLGTSKISSSPPLLFTTYGFIGTMNTVESSVLSMLFRCTLSPQLLYMWIVLSTLRMVEHWDQQYWSSNSMFTVCQMLFFNFFFQRTAQCLLTARWHHH